MTGDRIDVLHAVTSSISLGLLRGQLGFLRTNGFRPAAVCSPGPQVEDLLAKEHVPVFTIAMSREISPLRDLLSLLRLLWLIRRLRPAICNAGTPKAGLLVGLAAWLNRVPCRIYTLRGLRLETTERLQQRTLRFFERIACACAHRVICVSPSLRRRAVELGIVSAQKAIVLGSGSSNGIDTCRFVPTPERLAAAAQIRQQLGIERDRLVIGYVGRFTHDKGISELVTAFRSLRQRFSEALLLLVGTYEEGDPVSSEVRFAIEGDSNVVRVAFTTDIAPYYLLMDIFVLPSHREGFPNAVLEAQAAERPVVTTQATGAVDSVCDGITGLLVPVGDAVALEHAIIRVLSDRSLSQRMGRAGRERVVREFRQEMVWQALVALYRELLQQRGLWSPSAQNSEAKGWVKES